MKIQSTKELDSTEFLNSGLLSKVVDDDTTEEQYFEYLKKCGCKMEIILDDGSFGCLFTLEDKGTISGYSTVEIHTFVPVRNRKYVKQFLKGFSEFIFNNTNFDVIITTVPEHTSYVGSYLKFIGFQNIGTITNQYKFNSVEYSNITYYALNKGN